MTRIIRISTRWIALLVFGLFLTACNAKTFVVTFVNDNGATIEWQLIESGQDAVPPQAPVKVGYTFAGWDSDYHAITAAMTITATYTINQYTIAFEENGGTAVADILQDYNTAVTAPAAPAKTGYAFAGWYRNVGLTTAYVFSTMPAADLTLYAKWTINQYTIAFEENGGSAVVNLVQAYDTAVTAPTAPSKTGYVFAGWYSDIALTTPYVFSTMPVAGITLYAKWTINQFTISFEENGGTAVDNLVQDYNTAVVEPTAPTKTGYAFAGWYSDIALTTPYVFSTMPVAGITLYAKWTVNQSTIAFEENGGTVVTDILQDYNSTVTAPPAPTKTGHTFNGWYSDIGLTTPYVFSTMPITGITLYAKWTIHQFTVTFEDWSEYVFKMEIVDYGAGATAPADPTRTGFTFAGWDADFSVITEDLRLFATYTLNTYTLEFKDYDGTVLQTTSYDFYSYIYYHVKPANPLRTGYTFHAWDHEVPVTMPAEDLVITATYNINQYTISFESNGGSAVDSITQNYGTIVNGPTAPTRIGMTFVGWYGDIGLTTPFVFSTMPAENKTLYAKWTIDQYTVTFEDYNEGVLKTETVDYGAGATAPADPLRTGYTFIGWDVNYFNITANLTVTATYWLNAYLLQFVDHDGTVIQSTAYYFGTSLSSYVIPANPVRSGYTFTAWDHVVPATMPAENILITATYVAIQYSISFNSNGGSAVATITQDYGSAVSAPADPTKTNSFFGGWYGDSGLTTPYVFSTMPAQNKTVYAKWYSDGLLFTLIDGGTHYAVARGTASGNILIPATYNGLPVTAIAENGFDRFGQSWTFTSLTLSEGLISIGANAFRSLPWTSVTLPSTLVTLGNSVFAFNGSLTSIDLPAGVTGISEQMFSSCTNLQNINVDPANPFLTSLDGVLFNDDMTTLIAYPNGNSRTTYTVPSSVTTLAAYAFRQFNFLQTLVFQTGLTTIAQYAISSSSSLLTVYLPLGVVTVGSSAIWNCTNLTIRVAAAAKPAGWDNNWNASSRPVVWSYVQ